MLCPMEHVPLKYFIELTRDCNTLLYKGNCKIICLVLRGFLEKLVTYFKNPKSKSILINLKRKAKLKHKAKDNEKLSTK